MHEWFSNIGSINLKTVLNSYPSSGFSIDGRVPHAFTLRLPPLLNNLFIHTLRTPSTIHVSFNTKISTIFNLFIQWANQNTINIKYTNNLS